MKLDILANIKLNLILCVFIALFYFNFAFKIAIDAVMAIQINQRCEQIMFTIFFIVEYLFPAGSHPVCRSTPY